MESDTALHGSESVAIYSVSFKRRQTMNNSMKITTAVLGMLLVICLIMLYSLSSQRKLLFEELDGLRKARTEASLQISNTSDDIEKTNRQITSLKQSAKGEKLQKEIDQLEA